MSATIDHCLAAQRRGAQYLAEFGHDAPESALARLGISVGDIENAVYAWRKSNSEIQLALHTLRRALKPFADRGDPAHYQEPPELVDVPYDWCVTAWRAMKKR